VFVTFNTVLHIFWLARLGFIEFHRPNFNLIPIGKGGATIGWLDIPTDAGGHPEYCDLSGKRGLQMLQGDWGKSIGLASDSMPFYFGSPESGPSIATPEKLAPIVRWRGKEIVIAIGDVSRPSFYPV
jgi:hypothetical protein